MAAGLRTNWHPDQPEITPSAVSSGLFGRLWSTAVKGQVYAEPVVDGKILLVATEMNNLYGLDSSTGAVRWHRHLDTPWNPAAVSCSDLEPRVGVTSTPALDVGHHIAYLSSKTYARGSSGAAAWKVHAIDTRTGRERPHFPVTVQGRASNARSHVFTPTTQMQRPGLLLMNGVVYLTFGGHCDRKPYEGFVAGVSTRGRMSTLWTDEAAGPQGKLDGGIWMPGGLTSDRSGEMLFASGNGVVPAEPTLGHSHTPKALAQAVVRLEVRKDGTLTATDFFAPYNAAVLNKTDSDVGSGGPMVLPAQYFGTKKHPRLVLQIGKQGLLHVLDADDLGGMGQGKNGGDKLVQRIGPIGKVWGQPGVWPGNGGYAYLTTASSGKGSGRLEALKYGLDGAGKPLFSSAGRSATPFGYTSSAPVVTSNGLQSGSALVWTVWTPAGDGAQAQLRAYDAVPTKGTLKLRFSAAIGTASKFLTPVVGRGKVYVGTRDGHVVAFGQPSSAPVTAPPLTVPATTVGRTTARTLTLTATRAVQLTGLTTSGPFTVGTPVPGLPARLTKGQTVSVAVTFRPTVTGPAGGTLTVATSKGSVPVEITGTGQAAGPLLVGDPTTLSFEPTTAGGEPARLTVTYQNQGAGSLKVTSVHKTKAPFRVTGAPRPGSTIAPGASVTVTIRFAPRKVGTFRSTLAIGSTGGTETTAIDGRGGSPAKLALSTKALRFGRVAVGAHKRRTFTVSNRGGTPLTITKSKPPATHGVSAASRLDESTVIQPGKSVTETMVFAPSVVGPITVGWIITGDDDRGLQTVKMTGTGTRRR